MFGLFKSRQQREAERVARADKNELECLMEIAQDYAEGKYGVTREYATRCLNDYMTRGAYSRNCIPANEAMLSEILSEIRANIERGDKRPRPSVLKTYVD
jgi:hypothetical protein